MTHEELANDLPDHRKPGVIFVGTRDDGSSDETLREFEGHLSRNWPLRMDGQERALRVVSAFWRTVQGAINRLPNPAAELSFPQGSMELSILRETSPGTPSVLT